MRTTVPAGLTATVTLALLTSGAPPPLAAQPEDPRYAIVPVPREVEARRGEFVLSAETRIVAAADLPFVDAWAERIRRASGFPLPITRGDAAGRRNVIVLRVTDTRDTRHADGRWDPGDESYTVDVTSQRVLLEANELPGLFYGLQTLRQLLPGDIERYARAMPGTRFTIPALRIEDAPRFRYRGMHLDVGRHFFPVDFIERYIDLLALYKFNAFHWHLTEDQGWRIQIEKYPRLTEVGSIRRETPIRNTREGNDTPYGGFYTQEEVRRVVAHARARNLTIIPEIEMPGHSRAALAAYPELGCTGEPVEVATRWGVFPEIYCPSERTFAFLEDVLTEVMELFPGPFVHIGGDEAPKRAWEASPLAQDVIRREALADEAELQSWFIRRIERFLLASGRRLIGWDEILEGGLAPEATVMSWRGEAGGIEAARQGHDVIMTPNSHLYFDHYQGDPAQEPFAICCYSSLEDVYAYEPIPVELNAAEADRVLGAQANVWTEYIPTPSHVEYMAFPRAIALSEVLWSPRDRRNRTDFQRRLPAAYERLTHHAVRFRIPEVAGLDDGLTLGARITVSMDPPPDGMRIRYTTDGSEPGPYARRYDGPFELDVADGARTVVARVVAADGRTGPRAEARFERTTLRPSHPVPAGTLLRGLAFEYFEGRFPSIERLTSATPLRTGVAQAPALTGGERAERFALRFRGYLRVTNDALYTFRLASDGAVRLLVGETEVIGAGASRGVSTRRGQIALRSGLHPVVLEYLHGTGEAVLRLAWHDRGVPRSIPADRWHHRDGTFAWLMGGDPARLRAP